MSKTKLTVVSRDGQWKADLHAWKDWWVFYASIGAEVTVYRRQEHKNTWGDTVDWVRAPAFISISNTYYGRTPTGEPPPEPSPPQPGPPYSITQTVEFREQSYGQLKLWATGILKITIDTGGGTTPGGSGAKLIVDRVVSTITIGVRGDQLQGVVDAGSYVIDQSTW